MGLKDGELMSRTFFIIRDEQAVQALVEFARRIVGDIQNPLPPRGQIPDDDQSGRQQDRRDGHEIESVLFSIHRAYSASAIVNANLRYGRLTSNISTDMVAEGLLRAERSKIASSI